MKRIVSLVLALSMVLSMFSFAFAGSTLADVEATDYEAAVSALVELGIVNGYEDGTYKPEKAVSRAEMAKFLVVSAGLEPAADVSKGATNFSDVAANHWASGYINVASEYGYINGYPEGTFAPEATVSYAEAVTMAIRVLGYKSVVESKGTWPTNYIAKAQELKVLQDVEYGKYTDGATRGNVALLMWNMLTTHMWDVTSENESNGLNFSDANGVTMIDKYFEDYAYIDEEEEIRVSNIEVDDEGKVWVTLTEEGYYYDEQAEKAYGYNARFELARDVEFVNLYGRTVSVLFNEDDEEIVMLIPSNKDKVVKGYAGKLLEDDYTLPSNNVLAWGTEADAADTDLVVGVIDTKKAVEYATRYQTIADNYIVEEIEEVKNGFDLTSINDDLVTVSEDAIVLLDGEWLTAKDIEVGDIVTVLSMNEAESMVMLCAISREVAEGEFEAVTDKTEIEDYAFYITVDGEKYEAVLDNKVYEMDENDKEIANPETLDVVLADKDHKFYGEECSLYLNFLGEVVRIEFAEVIDPESEGEFYVLTNNPAYWTASDKSGVITYVELNGETYEVKTSSEKIEEDTLDSLVAGSVVSVNLDSKDRVVEIIPVEAESDAVEGFTFQTTTEEMDDQKYVDGIKIGSETKVYTITEVKDEDEDIIGYEVEITKGSAALKGVKAGGLMAIDEEYPSRAAYVFVEEEAKNTDVMFNILTDLTQENGIYYVTVAGKVYELDEDNTAEDADVLVAKSDVGSIIAYSVNDDVVTVKYILAVADLADLEDDKVTSVDGELFATANMPNGDFDVIAEESGDLNVFLVKAKKNTDGEYKFNSCKLSSLEEISLDENEDIFMVLEGDVEAIVVIEGYKFTTGD